MRLPALLLVVVFLSCPAWAQVSAPAFELERLTLNPSGQGGLLVGGADLLPVERPRLTFGLHYEHDPLLFVGPGNERLGTIVQSRITTHLALAYSVHPRVELGAQLPIVAWQGGSSNLASLGVTPVQSFALGTPWLQARVGLIKESDGQPVDCSADVLVGLPFGSAQALTRDDGLSLMPRLGLGRTLSPKVRLAAEVGLWLRPSQPLSVGNVPPSQLGSQLDLGFGATSLGEGLRYEGSLRLAVPLTQTAAAVELLAGVRYPIGPFELFGIAGPGLGKSPGTPLFRALAGVAWTGDLTKPPPPAPPKVVEAPKPPPTAPPPPKCVMGKLHVPKECPDLDLDEDGVTNAKDKCPMEKGAVSAEGCPDQDGDQVADADDACPAVAGDRALKGCPDADHDGLTDAEDACPQVAGVLAFKGCPDTDQDGLADADDACPTVAGTKELKGCPDTDADGLADAEDLCPKEAGPTELKGCPDQDKDGVADREDNCKIVPGPKENQGCPAEQKQLVIITSEKLVIKDKVYFDTGKSTIQKRSFAMLDQIARILTEHTEVPRVSVEGHTDSQGKADFNRKLSQTRADSVMAYLIKKGVDPGRLESKGFGPDVPVGDNKTAAGREQNRRVEFVIKGGDTKSETKATVVP